MINIIIPQLVVCAIVYFLGVFIGMRVERMRK